MTSSAVNKNLGGRPATGIGTLVGVRLQPDQLGELDDWINAQTTPRLTRPEAIRQLLREALSTATNSKAPP